MHNYKVTSSEEHNGFIVQGDFEPNSIPIEIPSDNINKNNFIYLFLNKADIERGIDCLRCISIDKNKIENEALFIAGLNNCIKCFQKNGSRGHLNPSTVFKGNGEMKACFDRFLNLRNKHYIHDDNEMLQAIAFLLISPKNDNIWGGLPSVIWNKIELDYYREGLVLQNVMNYIYDYICSEIDRIGDLILSDYKDCQKEELLKLPKARIKLASAETPGRTR